VLLATPCRQQGYIHRPAEASHQACVCSNAILLFGRGNFWLAGNGSQPNGTTLDTTLFHFAGPPVQAFPSQVFRGNAGCSPHSPSDYMTIENMVRMDWCNHFPLRMLCFNHCTLILLSLMFCGALFQLNPLTPGYAVELLMALPDSAQV
jgi:hypothetical protein